MVDKFYTEREMLEKEQFWAVVCLGGMSENFDYSEAKSIMRYWAQKRHENNFCGGPAKDVNAVEAQKYLENHPQ